MKIRICFTLGLIAVIIILALLTKSTVNQSAAPKFLPVTGASSPFDAVNPLGIIVILALSVAVLIIGQILVWMSNPQNDLRFRSSNLRNSLITVYVLSFVGMVCLLVYQIKGFADLLGANPANTEFVYLSVNFGIILWTLGTFWASGILGKIRE